MSEETTAMENTAADQNASDVLLEVKNLQVAFRNGDKLVPTIRGISYTLHKGEIFGLVGESGSGKSISSNAIIRLLPSNAVITGGEILFEGKDVLKMSKKEVQKLRGSRISEIFQDPMTSLDPLFTIGYMLDEVLKKHTDLDKEGRKRRSLELLEMVGINQPERRLKQYPHEFSGGMQQRAMIAMALACNPELLIADEPTTALDVTIQAQIMDLLKSLSKQLHTAIILITHDLGVVADICDRVAVMYAGEIVETGNRRDIFYHHEHPYTKGLLDSVPGIDDDTNRPLIPIRGNPPEMSRIGSECAFARRCPYAMNICARQNPEELSVGEGHSVRCWLTVRRLMEEQKQENAKR
ncbi:MAG: ABC transporter ATP-binding protein [Lachnospiraceae bacterium]|jgi:oligopeptide transport system ATP-binding protein